MSKRSSSPSRSEAAYAKRQEFNSNDMTGYRSFAFHALAQARARFDDWKCDICKSHINCSVAITLCGTCLFCPFCIQQHIAERASRLFIAPPPYMRDFAFKSPWSIQFPDELMDCPNCQEQTTINWKHQWPLSNPLPGIMKIGVSKEKIDAFDGWIQCNPESYSAEETSDLPDAIADGSGYKRIEDCPTSNYVEELLCYSAPFQCSYCFKQFPNVSAIRAHIHAASCFRRGLCWYCKKRFSGSMRSHVTKDCNQVCCPAAECTVKGNWELIGSHVRLHTLFDDPFDSDAIIKEPPLAETALLIQHIDKLLANQNRAQKLLTFHGKKSQLGLLQAYEKLSAGARDFWAEVLKQQTAMDEATKP